MTVLSREDKDQPAPDIKHEHGYSITGEQNIHSR